MEMNLAERFLKRSLIKVLRECVGRILRAEDFAKIHMLEPHLFLHPQVARVQMPDLSQSEALSDADSGSRITVQDNFQIPVHIPC